MKRDIYIREIQLKDLADYKNMIQPGKIYHKFNGPYYTQMTIDEIDDYIKEIHKNICNGDTPMQNKKMIVDKSDDKLVGQVNWYWKSEETHWLEVGIVIFNENYWGKGIGAIALPAWIDEIFLSFPQIIRIGLSTWSGNLRMIKLAKKIGLKKEAEYKNARIVNGIYYDSLSFGILKKEWEYIQKVKNSDT